MIRPISPGVIVAIAIAATGAVEGSQAATDEPSIFALDAAPSRGPAGARAVIVVFSDFQCPYCADGRAFMDAVLRAYGDDVRLVFKQWPLPSHPQARLAAAAALAARAQGHFWEMHDGLFES